MIKGVLLDLDGTLLDRSNSLKRFITSQYNRMLSDSNKVSLNTYMNDFLQSDDNGYNSKENVYHYLIEKYNLIPELHDTLVDDYYSRFHDNCLPFEGFEVLIQFLKESKLKIGLITNGRENFQRKTLDALSLNEFFHCELISETEGLKKPSPDLFNRGLEELKLKGEEAIFIGDHPINDIKAAKKLQMRTIWIESSHYEKPAYADFSVQSLATVPSIIQTLNGEESL